MTQRQPTLSQACQALRKLKEQEAKAKDKYDELKAKRERAEIELIQRMEGEEAESHKTAGVLFVPTRRPYGTVQDRQEFVKWAQENAPELVEAKERKGLVNEIVRQRLDDGEDLPPGVGYYVKEYVSQRAA